MSRDLRCDWCGVVGEQSFDQYQNEALPMDWEAVLGLDACVDCVLKIKQLRLVVPSGGSRGHSPMAPGEISQ